MFDAYDRALRRLFAGRRPDVTEENLQARIRGNTLMALSNKFGWLVLTTGNKSEVSVGYSTLYGDTAGGFAVLKDVSKTMVYALARAPERAGARAGEPPIPERDAHAAAHGRAAARPDATRTRCRPTTCSTRSSRPTSRRTARAEDLVGAGHRRADLVRRGSSAWWTRNEYKRRQRPPGIKITPRAFGRDRRLPITNAFRRETGPAKPKKGPSRGQSAT